MSTIEHEPRRALLPEEEDVVARLAARYGDLRLVELELGELDRLRGRSAGAGNGSRYSPGELLDLHQAGLISARHVRRMLGLERRSRASARYGERPAAAALQAPVLSGWRLPALGDVVDRFGSEWWARLLWALLWRWALFGAGMVFLPSGAEVRAATGSRLVVSLVVVVAILVAVVVGLSQRLYANKGVVGSLFRVLLAIVVVNIGFLLPTGLLAMVMLVAFLVATGDAIASVFWWRRAE